MKSRKCVTANTSFAKLMMIAFYSLGQLYLVEYWQLFLILLKKQVSIILSRHDQLAEKSVASIKMRVGEST